jgi:hypothetical protein
MRTKPDSNRFQVERVQTRTKPDSNRFQVEGVQTRTNLIETGFKLREFRQEQNLFETGFTDRLRISIKTLSVIFKVTLIKKIIIGDSYSKYKFE